VMCPTTSRTDHPSHSDAESYAFWSTGRRSSTSARRSAWIVG